MTVYVGGLRARLVRDSVFHCIDKLMTDLGWYAPADSHQPIRFLADPLPLDVEVPLNTMALSEDGDAPDEIELGSQLAEHNWSMFVDFYGENEALALHVVRDIADGLAGRMSSLGRFAPLIEVYDWTLATPVCIFTVQLEQIKTERAHNFPHPWLRHWYSCSFTVIDTYENESG